MRTIGIIPARAGSKSIPHKNTAKLGGKPLVEWCIRAAVAAKSLNYLVCSTDDMMVRTICALWDVPVLERPKHLANGDVPIIDVIRDVLVNVGREFDVMALIQPTSPFLKTETIDECIKMLEDNQGYNSVQTIAKFPHNHHAYNQRTFKLGKVEFAFKKEREACYNKQLKPSHCVFGNFVATRIKDLDKGVFAEPSYGVFISRQEAVDVDSQEDLEYAQFVSSRT